MLCSYSQSSNVIVTAGHEGIKFWDIRYDFLFKCDSSNFLFFVVIFETNLMVLYEFLVLSCIQTISVSPVSVVSMFSIIKFSCY